MQRAVRNGLALLAASVLLMLPFRSSAYHIIPCSGDITEELQQYVEESNWGERRTAFIQLTAGECEITRTIKICKKEGLRIEGAGRGATVLSWNPPDAVEWGPMFSLQAASGVRFAHLGICVASGKSLKSAIDMYNMCHACELDDDGHDDCSNACDPESASITVCTGCVVEYGDTTRTYDSISPGESNPDPDNGDYFYKWGAWPNAISNSLEDVAIGACGVDSHLANGVRIRLHPGVEGEVGSNCNDIPGGDCHNEGHTFSNVHVSEFHDSAFVVEGRNAKGTTFYDIHCDGRHDGLDSFAEDCCGYSCVRTGRVLISTDPGTLEVVREPTDDTSGNFYWYGGTATHISEAVFLLGSNTDTVHISGLQADRSKALISMEDDDYILRTYPVVVDSVRFDTDWVDQWNRTCNPNMDTSDEANCHGKAVFFPLRGPLILRNNVFGHCGGSDPPDNVSIGWAFERSPDWPQMMSSGFVFEGNAIGTSNDNPFVPADDLGYPEDYEYVDDVNAAHGRTWTYPTTQRSNLICTLSEDDSTYHWTPMPQHFTEVDTDALLIDGTVSVAEVGTSHDYYLLTGDGTIANLLHGVEGQEVMLVAAAQSSPEVQDDDTSLVVDANIDLYGNSPWTMDKDDVLWLVLGSDGVWRELSRSTNR